MRNILKQAQNINRRSLLLGGAQCGLLSLLGGRLYYLQVKHSAKYTMLSEDNRIRLFPMMPERGKIYDRNGKLLADSVDRHQLWLDVENPKQAKRVIPLVRELLQLSYEEVKWLEEAVKSAPSSSLLVKDFLDWNMLSSVQVHMPELPGVQVESLRVRNYVMGGDVANVLGYIGAPTESDIKNNRSKIYKHPGFKLGKTGLEKAYNNMLQGSVGVKRIEVNAVGTKVRELSIEDSTPGRNLTLTIDAELQAYVMEKLSGKGGLEKEGGAAVVMDIRTGDVLAMASTPSYDPNMFVRGINNEEWKNISSNIDLPLINKTVAAQYPPGSTFKIITSLAALKDGIVDQHTSFYCPGHMKFGGRKFHCWDPNGHGDVNLERAIAKSCNVYFYNVAKKLKVDSIADMAAYFGLGEVAGIGLPDEKPGLIPTESWKKKTIGERWYRGETLSVSIGQGFVLATPLQLAVMISRMASGREVKPRLIRKEGDVQSFIEAYNTNDPAGLLPEFSLLDVNRSHMNMVRKGLNMVVNDPEGGSYRLRIKDDGYEMAGKTGTAQTRRRRYKHIPKERSLRHHAWFTGYAPVHNPRFAVAVLVEHGGYGAVAAAPVARDLLKKVQGL